MMQKKRQWWRHRFPTVDRDKEMDKGYWGAQTLAMGKLFPPWLEGGGGRDVIWYHWEAVQGPRNPTLPSLLLPSHLLLEHWAAARRGEEVGGGQMIYVHIIPLSVEGMECEGQDWVRGLTGVCMGALGVKPGVVVMKMEKRQIQESLGGCGRREEEWSRAQQILGTLYIYC